MAVNPKRRQRKLEKKRALRKSEKKALARRQSQGLTAKFRDAAKGRLLHCECATTLWDQGLGQFWVSRELHGGLVAVAIFLIDADCLGVKDVVARIVSRSEYFTMHGSFTEKYDIDAFTIECARKLVERAVAFAAEAEIQPHRDYAAAALIFGDADASLCTREFKFPTQDMPTFIPGPNDTPYRCREVLEKLKRRYGPDGFRFIITDRSAVNLGLSYDEEYDDGELDDVELIDDEDHDGRMIERLPPR